MEQLPSLLKTAANEFRDSWTDLRKTLTKNSGVKINTKVSAIAAIEDIFGLLAVLIEAHDKCLATSGKQYEKLIADLPPKGKPSSVKSALEELEHFEEPRRNFASCLKAMFFFLRMRYVIT
jgi:hypothetical protein